MPACADLSAGFAAFPPRIVVNGVRGAVRGE